MRFFTVERITLSSAHEKFLTVQYAWLARTLFDSIEEVQDKAARSPWTYNHEHPNLAFGGITPMQEVALAA